MTDEILGHYRILEKLGEGGMGVVFKASDTHLDRFVALKVLPPDKVADPERKRRFAQEARAASALNHPNIVHIYDIAEQAGTDFIAMEYVAGRTLDRVIGRTGMGLGEALGYAVQIADALAKAHAAGIVHRDLKPANIMVNEDGVVKLLDFGLAKLTEPDTAGAHDLTRTAGPLTEPGAVVGTAAYMSPEQAQGQAVDSRSDVFSFGAVLYEMVTGQRAFQGESRATTLASVLDKEPAPLRTLLPSVPSDFERLLVRCLRKDPKRRWQSMADLKIALQELKEDSDSGRLQGEVVAARRRPKFARWAVPVITVVLAVAAFASWRFWPRPPAPEGLELTRITFDTGLTRYPAISPDGRLLAYCSDRDGAGNLNIYVQQINSPTAVQVTHDDVDNIQPSFSPDGARIVFRSERGGGGIYVMDVLGGQQRKLADLGWHPVFSPDGTTILYTEVADPTAFSPSRMYLVSAQGGAPQPFQPDFRVSSYPGTGPLAFWSASGDAILFPGASVTDPASRDWWVAPRDGGAPVPTGAARGVLQAKLPTYPLAWFGNRVIFGTGSTVEGFNLYWADIDPKTYRISDLTGRLTTGPENQADSCVADDGTMVFSSLKPVVYLWSLPLDPVHGTAAGPPHQISRDEMVKTQPVLSRDASKLAYGAYGRWNVRWELRLRDMKSGTEASFTTRSGPLLFPRISPDGSTIAYRDVIEKRRVTDLVSIDSSTTREICENCTLRSFFANSNEAVVQYGNELVRQDLKNGGRTTLLEVRSGALLDAALSQDDKWLAFQVRRPTGSHVIFVCRVGDGPIPEKEWIVADEEAASQESLAWSADANLLYFLSERDGHTCIWARRLDPSSKVPVGSPSAVYHEHGSRFVMNQPRGYGGISVARDTLVFWRAELTGNVFRAELEKR